MGALVQTRQMFPTASFTMLAQALCFNYILCSSASSTQPPHFPPPEPVLLGSSTGKQKETELEI